MIILMQSSSLPIDWGGTFKKSSWKSQRSIWSIYEWEEVRNLVPQCLIIYKQLDLLISEALSLGVSAWQEKVYTYALLRCSPHHDVCASGLRYDSSKRSNSATCAQELKHYRCTLKDGAIGFRNPPLIDQYEWGEIRCLSDGSTSLENFFMEGDNIFGDMSDDASVNFSAPTTQYQFSSSFFEIMLEFMFLVFNLDILFHLACYSLRPLSAFRAQLHTLALHLDVSWPMATHTAQHWAEIPLHPRSLDWREERNSPLYVGLVLLPPARWD
jgi:hypothetical protein